MNAEPTFRCAICRCYLDEDDLFCSNCGTESHLSSGAAAQLKSATSLYSFGCQSCGASMSYDASARALRCPFCGSSRMERQQDSRGIKPNGVVPLVVTRERAESLLRNWLGKGFWRPSDAARAARIGEIAAVYVPYWVFEAQTDTQWAADSSPAPMGARGQWYPVCGTNSSRYAAVLVGGSSVLTPAETAALTPFDVAAALPPQDVDLDNAIVEEFRVPRKIARPIARQQLEQFERQACHRLVPNQVRNLRINMQVSSMMGQPLLLPVWILAYEYKQTVHRVLINGQTAAITGSAPFSYGKLLGVVLTVGLVLLALLILVMLAN
ncbi:MAG: hypothetical protein KDB22_25160 [Planctomycetales bacterium]|nr:hypothetical protein [Planctomycetales bacterium]